MQDDRKECCVLCGKKVDIYVSTPIGKRRYYVQGAGQLCRECYERVYLSRRRLPLL